MKKVYLDYAATTPADPRVKKAIDPFLNKVFGNTMSLHSFGQEAKMVLEESRERVAKLINAKAEDVYFTSSATESNNWVLKGISGRHIIISSIEHACIEEAASWLERKGVKVTRVPVDKFGKVNPLDVEKSITEDTALVSIIHATNEIGTIQDIKEIGRICHEKKVLFHTDASQSFGKIPIDINEINIDLLTASSHKIYGPKGAAILYVKKGIGIKPLIHGGGQESGLRSSTVNVPAIAGFAKACEIAQKEMKKEAKRLSFLRNKLIKEVLKINNAYLTGHPKDRLPNNASFYFSFVEGESIVLHLDFSGIAVSTGSACSSAKLSASHVLLATGLKHEQAHGSVRVSLGRWTTEDEIEYFVKKLKEVIEKLRAISPFKR
ncbi:MAG: cysteine desulfurase family protein [bacterium]|nr:cysteine desulfurase family protein [bacterium]